MRSTDFKKEIDVMKNCDGDRIFTILSNGDVSIGRNLLERRI